MATAAGPSRPVGRGLGEVARLFVKLGVIGFGGPAAHIALMRDEVVRRRGWVTDAELMDLVGACNLIPGPNSTELALALGRRRAGGRGLVVAGVGFIVPAALIVAGVAVLYRRWGAVPAVLDVRRGVLPVVVALVALALWSLGRATVRSPARLAVVVVAAVAWLGGVGELPLLLFAAAGGGLRALRRPGRGRGGSDGAGPPDRARGSGRRRWKGWRRRNGWRRARPPLGAALLIPLAGGGPTLADGGGPTLADGPPPHASPTGLMGGSGRALGALGAALVASGPAPVALGRLFLVFFKVGALLYGSGYVLISYLQRDLVERLGWLSEAQLLDAVAVGQLTPGPLFTTATFVGYQLGGAAGALVATVAIFLPSFAFVAALHPLVDLARRSPWAAGALEGVNLASLGLLGGVSLRLAHSAVPDPAALALALVALLLGGRFGVGSGWLVAGGASVGLALALTV